MRVSLRETKNLQIIRSNNDGLKQILISNKLLKTCKRQNFCIIPQNDELMKQYSLFGLLILATALALSSCQVIGGIFKAGVWVGILLVVLVVGIILWLVGRGRS
jgi:hypothetical protein